ncbi:hypothetical protein RN001_001734 [Aquatica leii]|uniref:Acyltransferase 3 domain-containing protein n=1 Tax=Aquatica leii TaxID=1421715 RepID=A0AAN7SR04_9COLE|nr:hypothetical protein RN001_001734 [Aquatica leii]
MQYNIFCAVTIVLFLNAESKVAEKDYALMPPLFYTDDFDRCLMLGEKALFCTVTVQLGPVRNNYSKVWTIIEDVISYKTNFRHDRLRHSICVPSHCTQMGENVFSYINDTEYLQLGISECYKQKYAHLGLIGDVIEMRCENDKSPYEVDVYDIVVGLCLIGLLALLIFASFYEGLARYKSKEEYNSVINSTRGRIIACFSLLKNWDRLKTRNTGLDAQALKAINGIRFYTILLVIIAHACMIAFTTYSLNPQFVETMTDDPLNMIFLNGNYSMQTFLLISGLLLSYHFFLSFEKMKKLKFSYIFLALINRYIRLTSCLVVIIAISATWLRHVNRGPLWDKTVGDEFRNCRKNWWTNLLYINNYYDVQHMCLLHSWYLAADTQLFVLSLIILTLIWNWKKYTMTIFGICFVIGFLIPTVTTYIYDYDILIREYPEPLYKVLLDVPEWTKLLIPGHMNIGGYTIGLIAGYIVYKYRERTISFKKRFIVLWWILVWGLPLSVIFLGVPMYRDNYVPTRLGASLYQGLARNVFAIGICLGILGINKNIGWFLRDAVLWQPLQILGRLTYCVFLVHVALIRIKFGQARVLSYMTSYSFFTQVASDLVLSFISGLILCLAVEMPTSALQKLMMPQFRKTREDDLTKNIVADNVKQNEITQV